MPPNYEFLTKTQAIQLSTGCKKRLRRHMLVITQEAVKAIAAL
jgi:hypothetical protein